METAEWHAARAQLPTRDRVIRWAATAFASGMMLLCLLAVGLVVRVAGSDRTTVTGRAAGFIPAVFVHASKTAGVNPAARQARTASSRYHTTPFARSAASSSSFNPVREAPRPSARRVAAASAACRLAPVSGPGCRRVRPVLPAGSRTVSFMPRAATCSSANTAAVVRTRVGHVRLGEPLLPLRRGACLHQLRDLRHQFVARLDALRVRRESRVASSSAAPPRRRTHATANHCRRSARGSRRRSRTTGTARFEVRVALRLGHLSAREVRLRDVHLRRDPAVEQPEVDRVAVAAAAARVEAREDRGRRVVPRQDINHRDPDLVRRPSADP